MKLDMFDFQLNEDKVNDKIKDLKTRVKELRALNNSGDEISKKIASEFGKGYDQIRTLLLPQDLKRYAKMDGNQLRKVGEEHIKNIQRKYSKIAPQGKVSSRSAFLNKVMNDWIRGAGK